MIRVSAEELAGSERRCRVSTRDQRSMDPTMVTEQGSADFTEDDDCQTERLSLHGESVRLQQPNELVTRNLSRIAINSAAGVGCTPR